MLAPWLESFPRTTNRLLDEVDSLMGYKLSTVMAEGPSKVLSATPVAQPAIVATSIIILRILEQEYGFQTYDHADVVLGHSLGEFAALVCGDYLEFEDGLYLVKKRAEAMHQATADAMVQYGGEYGMVAIVMESPSHLPSLIRSIEEFVGRHGTREDDARADIPPIDQVLIANINSKNQIVLSGNIERIKTLIAHVRQFLGSDPRMVRLNADSPFHSPIMKPAVKKIEELLHQPSRVPRREGDGRGGEIDIIKWPGKLQCISNVTSRPFQSREQLKDLLARQCLETVRWWDSIKYLDQEQRVRRWIGIGPGKVGRNLVGKEVGMRGMDAVKGGGVWAITEPGEVEEALKGLEDTAGFGVDEYADYE
ncbi:malonyl CoA-acyl carrier protein transacylase [Zalerion maritima]|uniref:[acyl-carrier-protein] S-malonyltransferase n=1 Tax=Zalerion maritima TaxID=339359 RepID=A0AAD5RWA6_9PEZI|nr:malonyl CoA-acyl carrier protein transacylase [Zalerion maritima]